MIAANSTVAVAGAFSMAAGAWVAGSFQGEMTRLERDRLRFLGESADDVAPELAVLRDAVLVGVSYLLGPLVPVLPVLLGARTIVGSIIVGAIATVAVSAILSFLSGMRMGRRLLINGAILAGAVLVTYAIGLLAKSLFGVAIA